ncbi:MAG: hypothetical protein AB7O50_16155 [Pseudolabrys sp.]
MTFVTDAVSSPAAVVAHTKRRPGFFTRVLYAMMEARQKQAEREIAQYLALTGGKLTDDAEREIERRILRG